MCCRITVDSFKLLLLLLQKANYLLKYRNESERIHGFWRKLFSMDQISIWSLLNSQSVTGNRELSYDAFNNKTLKISNAMFSSVWSFSWNYMSVYCGLTFMHACKSFQEIEIKLKLLGKIIRDFCLWTKVHALKLKTQTIQWQLHAFLLSQCLGQKFNGSDPPLQRKCLDARLT